MYSMVSDQENSLPPTVRGWDPGKFEFLRLQSALKLNPLTYLTMYSTNGINILLHSTQTFISPPQIKQNFAFFQIISKFKSSVGAIFNPMILGSNSDRSVLPAALPGVRQCSRRRRWQQDLFALDFSYFMPIVCVRVPTGFSFSNSLYFPGFPEQYSKFSRHLSTTRRLANSTKVISVSGIIWSSVK